MAHDKLRALSCFKEMHDRIVAGISLSDVARWLQEDTAVKEFAATKADSLIRALARYKADIPPAELGLTSGEVAQERLEEVMKELDELEALSKLYNLQLRRIEAAAKLENDIGFPNSKLHADFEAARKLLEDSADLKFKLGIYKESERSMTVNHNHTTAKALETFTPAERQRIGGIAHRLLSNLTAGSVGAAPAALDGVEDIPFELVTSTPIATSSPAAVDESPSWFDYVPDTA